jgi:hypothetical protein
VHWAHRADPMACFEECLCFADSAFLDLAEPAGPAVGLLANNETTRMPTAAFDRCTFSNNTSTESNPTSRGTVAVAGTRAHALAAFENCTFQGNVGADVLGLSQGEALATPELSYNNITRGEPAELQRTKGLDTLTAADSRLMLSERDAQLLQLRRVCDLVVRTCLYLVCQQTLQL